MAETLEQFRLRVVKVAQQRAIRHGWCDEINQALGELGLGDLLPPRLLIQRKLDAARDWLDWASPEFKAIRSALREVATLNTASRQQASEQAHIGRPRTVTEIDRAMERLAAAKAALTDQSIPVYPMYRLVSKRYGSNDVEVITTAPPRKAPAKKAAVKAPAKKAVARKAPARRSA